MRASPARPSRGGRGRQQDALDIPSSSDLVNVADGEYTMAAGELRDKVRARRKTLTERDAADGRQNERGDNADGGDESEPQHDADHGDVGDERGEVAGS